jgi:hypothetical protein
MKHFFSTVLLICTSLIMYAGPIQFRINPISTNTSITGTPIQPGSEFQIVVEANGNSNIDTRQLLFDFEYDPTNLELVTINHTGTGGNGGILPSGSNIQMMYNQYPGYHYTGTNTDSNGNNRYNSATYSFTQGGPSTIIRAMLTWASPNGMPYGNFDRLLVLTFRVKPTSTPSVISPVKLNFVAGMTGTGPLTPTELAADAYMQSAIVLDQTLAKLITATVDVNSNLFDITQMRVGIIDSVTRTGQLFPVLANGQVDVVQSQLSANTVYEVFVLHDMDKLYDVYSNAITISDFTLAQRDYITKGLVEGEGTALVTGHSRYSADINRSRSIDPGDLPGLLAQVTGVDTLYVLPPGYQPGMGSWRAVPTWLSTDLGTVKSQVEYLTITPENGTNLASVGIDVRQLVGIDPQAVKSLQIFDIYAGPVQFASNDGIWAKYWIPTPVQSKIAASVFTGEIRQIVGTYALKASITNYMDNTKSWTSLTADNWTTLQRPRIYIKTGELGSNRVIDLKYLLWGDVNRSHSSQVVKLENNQSVLVTNAKSSGSTNTGLKTMNVTVATPSTVGVSLSNLTVTSNNIEIPVTVNTNGNQLGGLQFEFKYDNTKLKFEEIKTNVPATWTTYVNSKTGKVKFVALDQNNKTAITGSTSPFTLRFSTIGNGVDILTSIAISSVVDATDLSGNQLKVDLNRDKIKLIGLSNF